MTKEEEIVEWLNRPIQVGDKVSVSVPYNESKIETKGRNKTETITRKVKSGNGEVKKVLSIDGRTYYVVQLNNWSIPFSAKLVGDNLPAYLPHEHALIDQDWITPDVSHCGKNPFRKEPARIQFRNIDIAQLMSMCGYGRNSNNFSEAEFQTVKAGSSDATRNGTYGGANFDPFVTNKNGEKEYIQRGYVWKLEQKQDLIDSIFNWIDIGKFVLRYNSWPRLIAQVNETGHGFNWDVIDGKQRINAILGFVQNQYSNSSGIMWSEMSEGAQRSFLNYDRLAFAKLEEMTTDEMVVDTFLTLNYTGTPMSVEHIQYVQKIRENL